MSKSSTSRDRARYVVSVRLTEEDRELVAHVAESLGVSASKAIRLMLRRADAGIAVSDIAATIEELRVELDDSVRAFGLLSRALDRQGVLLNQIAAKVNAGAPVNGHALAVIVECNRTLGRAQRTLEAKPGEILQRLQIDESLDGGQLWL